MYIGRTATCCPYCAISRGAAANGPLNYDDLSRSRTGIPQNAAGTAARTQPRKTGHPHRLCSIGSRRNARSGSWHVSKSGLTNDGEFAVQADFVDGVFCQRKEIQAHLRKLPRNTYDALRMAAVPGFAFDFETLRVVHGWDDESLIQALESAKSARLKSKSKGRLPHSWGHLPEIFTFNPNIYFGGEAYCRVFLGSLRNDTWRSAV
jgi:hypothetical protein